MLCSVILCGPSASVGKVSEGCRSNSQLFFQCRTDATVTTSLRSKSSLNLLCHCRCDFRTRTIANILGWAGPTTVFRRVVAIVIDAINRIIPKRGIANIGNKVFGRFKPTLANSYPAPSVVFPSCMLWIGAALNHIAPNAVKPIVRQAVPGVALLCDFKLKTAAGLTCAIA